MSLAWPVIVSRSTQVVVGLADALMVAHLGAGALTAVTTGGLNAFAGFIFPMGIVFISGRPIFCDRTRSYTQRTPIY
ncbi:MAG: hypothetical protein HYX63_16235 [Gammaproteobacteria bacterium]|nr:hypothetical protein [Gammaproteobacteria bacterium]